MSLQLTLAILKPDITPMTYAMLNIRDRMLDGGFLIVRTKKLRLGRVRAEQFYAEHEGKVIGTLADKKKQKIIPCAFVVLLQPSGRIHVIRRVLRTRACQG